MLTTHRWVGHNGVKETLSELRSCFWTIKGQQFIRRALLGCSWCHKFEGSSYKAQVPAPLPEFRLRDDPAFSSTGVDYANPFYVYGTVERQEESSKVYMLLYTCASSRAVHLDLTPDLTAHAFLRSFRRFVSRHGIPCLIRSDNAKTFKSASKRLVTLLDLPKVQQFMCERTISWSFQLPKASWWGGFFERLIKSTKRCLRKMLGSTIKVTYDELLTLIVKVEAILNSRSLTYVYLNDVEEPLTPSHLIMGRWLLSIPDGKHADQPEDVNESGALTR